MTKNEYLNSLEEIVTDKIFITNNITELKEEIYNNCWHISADSKLTSQLKMEDFQSILKRIKENRLQQLNQSKINIDLIYYSWFDEQACQLRFNLINSNHKQLPFNLNNIQIIDNEVEIIDAFLNSNYHNGIPFEELQDVSTEDDLEEEIPIIPIKVYKEILKKK